METMKYPNVSGTNMAVSGGGNNTGHHVDEVDSLFTSPCWQNSATNLQSDFMDTHKLILDSSISNLGSDKMLLDASIGPDDNEIETKATMDALDNLLLSSQQTMAELKPLPPFTGYTANLSINGIQGHHYHTISQRCLPEENNNNSYNNSYNDHNNIVSSSTCNVVVNADSAGGGAADSSKLYVDDIKLGYSNSSSGGGGGGGAAVSDVVVSSVECHKNNDIEYDKYDITSIEDIAAIIGSAIADTTVPNDNNISGEDPNASRDSWMDLDAWIDGACGAQKNNIIISQDGLSDFNINSNTSTNSDYTNNNNNSSSKMQSAPPAPPAQQTSTLQTLLTHGYMPLLQNRLQNGPPIKQETPTSTNYNNADLISTSSPPANVVSTTDNMLMNINGRYMAAYSLDSDHPHHRSTSLRSPEDLMQNYPHTTTGNPTVTSNASKKSRSRAQKKAAAAAAAAAAAVAQQNAQAAAQQQQAATSTVFQAEQSSLGLLGKEKPVHRCNICNRGFLNKSNIKVHLRTHTGEKPFRCDTCAKAFRQKAHLLKHQQIHKRIGRD